MFTAEERTWVRSDLLDRASRDLRISGAAITGSGAAEREDRWSDIDLAFGVVEAADVQEVLADWTACLYDRHQALHHLDVKTGDWIFRVFLLPGTLQVDLAFVPETEFRPLVPTFRLVFGRAKEEASFPTPSVGATIGFGWLYALHARSCIARQKWWQAEYMISGIRDSALALACIRSGLPSVHGRGLDLLPREALNQYEDSLVRRIQADELWRAFDAAVRALLNEIASADAVLAGRLRGTMSQLVRTPGRSGSEDRPDGARAASDICDPPRGWEGR